LQIQGRTPGKTFWIIPYAGSAAAIALNCTRIGVLAEKDDSPDFCICPANLPFSLF